MKHYQVNVIGVKEPVPGAPDADFTVRSSDIPVILRKESDLAKIRELK